MLLIADYLKAKCSASIQGIGLSGNPAPPSSSCLFSSFLYWEPCALVLLGPSVVYLSLLCLLPELPFLLPMANQISAFPPLSNHFLPNFHILIFLPFRWNPSLQESTKDQKKGHKKLEWKHFPLIFVLM